MANRQTTFLLKRSNVPGKVPPSSGLTSGELALNTADAILYTSGSTANQILPIGWDRIHRTGDTVTGDFVFNGGISATTISATTYFNLPKDIYVTGGTYSSGTAIFTNNTGGTFTVTGFTNPTLTATSLTVDYIDFNTGATVSQYPGRINWDAGTGTLNVNVGDANTGLIDLQVGQEEIVRVYNAEATTLQKGEIVYVSGSQGNRPSVKRASAVSDGYSVTTLGMVDLAIASGSEGYVTTFGIISNLNTLGLTGGTPIWLSPTTPGAYTTTKPIAPQHTVLIGYVVRVSATVGSIFVNVSNGWELDEIHDVRISAATEGDLLVRSSYSGTPLWVNSKTLNGSYTINGNLTLTGNTVSETISATTYYNLPIKVSLDFGFDGTYTTTSSTFAQVPLNVVIQSASTYNNTYTGMTGILICDISQSDSGINGEFELYNLTDSTSITGSQTSFVDTDDLKSSSSFTISNLNFDDTFRIRMRRTSGSGTNNVRIRSAQLLLTLI